MKPLFTALHDTHGEALAMSSAIAGTLRIKSPYEFGAHHAGPVACELMGRYPDLVIRIDVEHEIVSPVVENYDIVFAMLESAAALDRDCHPKGFVAGARAVRSPFAAGTIRRAPHAGRSRRDCLLLTGPNDAPWAHHHA